MKVDYNGLMHAKAMRTACSQTCCPLGSSSEPVQTVSALATHVFAPSVRTFATANSKSSCVTCCLRSRRAYIPKNGQCTAHIKCHQRVIKALQKWRQRTGFCADTADLRTRTLAHLLRKRPQVDATLEGHLEVMVTQQLNSSRSTAAQTLRE